MPNERTLLMVLPLLLIACDSGSSKNSDTGNTGGDAGYGDGGSWGGSSGTWTDGGASDGGSSDWGSTDGGTTDGGTDTGDPDTGDPDPECDDVNEVAMWLSPDDSNSMSSPVQVRAAVLDGFGSLSHAPVRTWELFNYYSWDYEPADDDQLRITAGLAPTEADDTWRLQVGVSSPQLDKADRPPMNLAFSVDTSGSMGGRPIQLVKQTLSEIAGNLRSGDVVSMVSWDTSNNTILAGHTVTGPSDATLAGAIAGLESGGGTDLNKGLSEGYSLAQASFDENITNRVILLSDGGANAGTTSLELISEHAGDEGEQGIYLVGVGLSDAGNYDDQLMDAVTDAGRGASVYIEDSGEIQKVFGDRFVNTMEVAARRVEVELVLPPGFEIVQFSGEELSTVREEVEPQNIAPNDAMVFHNVIQGCAPDALTAKTPIGITVHWQDAVTWEQQSTTLSTTWGALLAADPAPIDKGTALMGYADALKAAKGLDVGLSREDAVQAALEAVSKARTTNPDDAELDEIEAVLDAL